MILTQENQLVRLQLYSNANMGSASGQVTLDRPTQVDSYYGLPFLPNSSIRGVVKAEAYARRFSHLDIAFGNEGVDEEGNRIAINAGKLIIGNGDLLCFPMLSANEQRCWIFPVHHIYKFAALSSLIGEPYKCPEFLSLVTPTRKNKNGEADTSTRRVLGIPDVPKFDLPSRFSQCRISGDQSEFSGFYNFLRTFTGNQVPVTEPWVVVASDLAGLLWKQAAEIRDATALKDKSAKAQSLRRVETIPADSVFLSLFTWLYEQPLRLPENAIQIGSMEGVGLGFTKLETVNRAASSGIIVPELNRSSSDRSLDPDHQIMVDMNQLVSSIIQATDSPVQIEKVKSAIHQFGWRSKKEGIETALGFCLAKAKPRSTKPKPEQHAYRWFLKAVLQEGDFNTPLRHEGWFNTEIEKNELVQIQKRWLWLRKFTELG